MASPKTLELMRQRRALHTTITVESSGHPGNRETRRQAARDFVKRIKRGNILGQNDKGEIVMKHKRVRGMSFHEALARV